MFANSIICHFSVCLLTDIFFLVIDFISFFLLCLIIFNWLCGHYEYNTVECLNFVFLYSVLFLVLTEI